MARTHDLPPFWDGWRVEWQGWDRSRTFICPPPKTGCEHCGTTAQPVTNYGQAWSMPGEARPFRRPKSFVEARANQVADRDGCVMLHLFVLRCPDCLHDSVQTKGSSAHDAPTEWWDLDESDYGGAGSEGLTQGLLF